MRQQAFRAMVEQTHLCWLASVDAHGRPMVTPKAVFAPYGEANLVIANIASAHSAANVRHNPQASVSLLDQAGAQGLRLHGRAEVVESDDVRFADVRRPLLARTGGQVAIESVILLQVSEVAPLVARAGMPTDGPGARPQFWLE